MDSYSKIEQILHQIVLGSLSVSEMLFDLEHSIYGKRATAQHLGRPIFVSGLARAGTTVLMRALYESEEFASLTYDDMPFVLAPNLWQAISGKNKKRRSDVERAHGDGIQVNFDSPEALEEVFWRLFLGDIYINSDYLQSHHIPQMVGEKFGEYQAFICWKYQKRRYLSKNNNHLLRLKSLLAMDCQPIVLLPFRDPVAQSISLMRQHQKFKQSPRFVRRYMEWLVHHEFGATHKPFSFDGSVENDFKPDTLAYWVVRWMEAYRHVLDDIITENNKANVHPVCYERLCNDSGYWRKICQVVDIPYRAVDFYSSNREQKARYDLPEELLMQAKMLYAQLESATF